MSRWLASSFVFGMYAIPWSLHCTSRTGYVRCSRSVQRAKPTPVIATMYERPVAHGRETGSDTAMCAVYVCGLCVRSRVYEVECTSTRNVYE